MEDARVDKVVMEAEMQIFMKEEENKVKGAEEERDKEVGGGRDGLDSGDEEQETEEEDGSDVRQDGWREDGSDGGIP